MATKDWTRGETEETDPSGSDSFRQARRYPHPAVCKTSLRHRLRRFSEQLHVIDLMNHHIRNALQPLMFLTFKPEGRAQTKLVEECVRHIEWALREVLPGKSEEQFVVKPADSLEEVARDRAASSSADTKRPAGIYKQSA